MRRFPPDPRGARPRAIDPNAVADRQARSVEEPLDVRLRRDRPYPLLEVRNPLHGTGYLVMLPEYPEQTAALCTCTDFARRGLGTCKHIEAGVRWLAEHRDARPLRPAGSESPPLSAVWKKVDQRLAALTKDAAPLSHRWRRPGAVLYEIGTEA